MNDKLGERKLKILSLIVEEYVKTGEPIGSKLLAESLKSQVSSATIRNEMSEMCDLGVLSQPHTSAGRIPTQTGFRVYVDSMMKKPKLAGDQLELMESLINQATTIDELLSKTTEAIAYTTKFAGVSTTPSKENETVQRIDIIPTSQQTAVIVLIISSGIVKNKMVKFDLPISKEALQSFYSEVIDKVIGLPLSELTMARVQGLAGEMSEYAFEVYPLLTGLLETVKETTQLGVKLKGQTNLLMFPEFFGGGAARELFEFLNNDKALASMLTQYTPRTKILIGEENGRQELRNSSLVFRSYMYKGKPVGTIGVIGPVRMDYGSLVTRIDFLTNKITEILEKNL